MIQINPLQSYIDGGARAALTTPPSASLVFDLPGKAIWVKGVKLKGIDHTYTFSHDNYITLTNTPDKNNPESEDINIGVNITTLKNVIDTTYNGGTLALLQEGLNTEERTWLAKILHNYINNVLPITKNLQINGTNYAIYTTEDSLPLFFAPTSLGTTGQILACTSSGLSWINLIQNTDYRVSLSSATNNSDYRIILKQEADNNPETNFVRFSEYLTFNPFTKTLKINNIKVVTATDIYVGATATAGLVPAATPEQLNYYLRGDGTWVNIATEMATANTWRPIKVENTDALGSSTDTGTLSFTAGTGITLAWDATNKRIIITNSSPDVNHNTDENVRQVPKTDNVNRPLMMINGSTSAGEQINTSMFSTGIYANASTKMITANGFIKAGSSDNYVLLGGGNHKALNDFSMSHEHPYLPLAGGTMSLGSHVVFPGTSTNTDYGGSIEFREVNYVATNQTDWSYAPGVTFHWGGYSVGKLGLRFEGNLAWKNNIIIHSGNYNNYAPTLTGTGASGTWNINISGDADTLDGIDSTGFLKNYSLNYSSTISSAVDISPILTAGIARVHIFNVEYSSVLTGYDFNNKAWQLRFRPSYNDGIYFRSQGTGTTWEKIAFISDIPTVTDYYWADVKVSAISNAATNPTFNSATATDRINATNYVFLNPNGDGIYLNNSSLNWHTNSSGQKTLLSFTSNGNVGIRTSSPSAQLHIYQTSCNGSSYGTYIQDTGNCWALRSLVILAPNLTSGSSPFIMIGKLDSTKNNGWIGYVHNADGSNLNRLSFGLHSVDNVLNILGTGNVGIGTTNPAYKLHVVGDIYTTIGFKKEGSSDSYVLLGGGGHKALSDFSMAHSHPYLPLSGAFITGTNIADMKVNIRNYFNGKPAGTNCYVGSPNIINNFLNDSASCSTTSVCGIMALNPGYDNYNHGHFLVSHYGDNRIGMIGLGYLNWYGPNWFAYTSDIPTRVSLLTNDSGFITSSHIHAWGNLICGSDGGDTYTYRALKAYGCSSTAYINFGYAPSTNNAGEIGFVYSGSGSGSNYMTLGFYGQTNRFNIYANNTISYVGNIIASNFYSSSDIRLKNNINNISKSIRSFNWKESGLKAYGLIAQEIENEYPELISNNDNGYKSINYTSALCMIIAKLENDLDELKEKVKLLEDKLRKYENTL